MARATKRTILSLDRYAKILGLNPFHFNGGSPIDLSDGRVLFPQDEAQNQIWPQYSYQNFDMVSREELASAIYNAEKNIIEYLGYSPVPMWFQEEAHDLPKSYRYELRYNNLAYNTSFQNSQIKTNFGYFISGGQRATTLIDAAVAVVRSDPDNDGWNELATIAVNIPVGTDPVEVKLYFGGFDADPRYEIRDPKSKTLSGQTLTFTYYSWMLVNPEEYDRFPTSDNDGKYIDMTDPTVFVTTVEAYREYNDTTQAHVNFVAGSVNGVGPVASNGFLVKSDMDSFVTPIEGNYDAVSGTWVPQTDLFGSADYIKLWYYAGMQDKSNKIVTTDDYLDNDFATAIAYMATARLERAFYSSNNAVTSRVASLQEDLVRPPEKQFYNIAPEFLANPFGSRRGEIMAWRLISRYKVLQKTGGVL